MLPPPTTLSRTDCSERKSNSRLSNIELLRIIAMILVMVVHSDFFSLGVPTIIDLDESPMTTINRVFIQAISICCVNVFVLISGYFGIRPKLRSLGAFIYQILFFFILIYVCCLIFGFSELNLTGILQCFCLTPANWFVKAYIILFVLAPVLNAFVDLRNQKLHRNILIFFFLIQTVYGCLHAANFFDNGYGPISFIGLYLLSRYIYVYKPRISAFKGRYYLLIYLISVLSLTFLSIILIRLNKNCDSILFTYINPIVIVESLALLLFFSKLRLQSKTVNRLAASAFAVYLFHANPNLLTGIFKGTITQIYMQTSGLSTISYIGIFLLIIFVISIVLDQFRKYSYEFLLEKIRNLRTESAHI